MFKPSKAIESSRLMVLRGFRDKAHEPPVPSKCQLLQPDVPHDFEDLLLAEALLPFRAPAAEDLFLHVLLGERMAQPCLQVAGKPERKATELLSS